jgi:hypothetical protein
MKLTELSFRELILFFSLIAMGGAWFIDRAYNMTYWKDQWLKSELQRSQVMEALEQANLEFSQSPEPARIVSKLPTGSRIAPLIYSATDPEER